MNKIFYFFKYNCFVLFLWILPMSLSAQMLTCKVNDAQNVPISRAYISVELADGVPQAHLSDSAGYFYLENIPYGKVQLEIAKEGYLTVHMAAWYNIQTRDVLQITMEKDYNILMDSLTITASSQLSDYDGTVTMNRSQYKTMAGSFQDPSRVLLHFPGFTTDNDGTNSFTFRGLPNYTSYWQIFDAEILNPNHLSTAGNRGDAASPNYGGVNVLSSSVISQYSFQPISNTISQSNSTSGVSNVNLSNNLRNFADFSLIGVEAGLCAKIGNKSIYGTARYSFVGLLEKLGIPFGNESINYQDVTLHAEIIKKEKITLRGYVIYGQSSNIHKAIPEEETKTTIKDFKNIHYQSNLGIIGIQSRIDLKKNQFINITLNQSFRRDQREEALDPIYINKFFIWPIDRNDISALHSSHLQYNFVESNQHFQVGFRNSIVYQPSSAISQGLNSFNHNRFYPYIHYCYILKSWRFNGGIALHSIVEKDKYYGESSDIFNYSFGFQKNFPSRVFIRFQQRYSDQLIGNIIPLTWGYQHQEFIHMKTHASELSIGKNTKQLSWRLTGFYNVVKDNNGTFNDYNSLVTTFNGLDYGIESETNTWGGPGFIDGRSYGIEAWTLMSFSLGNRTQLESMANVAYTSSKTNSLNYIDPMWIPSKNDIGYSGSFSTYLTVQDKLKEWNIGFVFHGREGMREYEIVDNTGPTYYTLDGMTHQLDPYMRVDFRTVFTKKGGNKRQHRISLDIQNVMNRMNPGFTYIDEFLKRPKHINQLGLIPVLGYRFEY
ncbi:MAG: carboxypeptidase-like regulatory domain-containing protein [Saprospiraceae bacterium]